MGAGTFCTGFSSSTAYAGVLEVPATFSTIQSAIDAAANGDVIQVSPGTYVENIDFLGKAITVRSSAGLEQTTIDGSSETFGPDMGSVVSFVNGEDAASILEGFTLVGGTGWTIDNSGFPFTAGGGVYANGSSPTLRQLRFTALQNIGRGGGAFFRGGTGPVTIEDCTFDNIDSGSSALYYACEGDVLLDRCRFEDNTAGNLAGALMLGPTITIRDCEFIRQAAEFIGGALSFVDVYMESNATPIVSIEHSLFEGNSAGLTAGVLLCEDGSEVSVVDCQFVGNTSEDTSVVFVGSGHTTMERCVFQGNESATEGMFGTSISINALTLDHCTAVGNFQQFLIRVNITSSVVWRNSIFSNNSGGVSVPGAGGMGSFDVSYSLFDDVLQPGLGNIMADPLLAGNLSLLPGSPAIDAGDPNDPLDSDGTTTDMGAFPFLAEVPFVRADANGDSTIDISDGVRVLRALFLGDPLSCESAGDANDSGDLTSTDALFIFSYLLLDGAPPPPPVSCGTDPTSDTLECVAGC